jgi:predicted type IV restriction endonuclease
MEISNSIQAIKALQGTASYDEITTKQTIVLQLFQALGWNIFSTGEVLPEFAVESRRVDYCLRSNGKNYVFVEVKKPAEELGKHEQQLLDYAFKQGIKLAVLTNGITWWFYLPLLGVQWKERRFYTIDIIEQESAAISLRFIELLGKDNVLSGKAIAAADVIHQNKQKARTIERTLPEAWNKMIGEPDQLLVEILLDTTEKMCGFRPQAKDIGDFLLERKDQILLDTFDEPEPEIQKVPQNEAVEKHETGRGSGPIVVMFSGQKFEGSSIPTLYFALLKHLVDTNTVEKAEIPWGVGSKRYFIFKGPNPTHQNGKAFFQPVTYKNYHLEGHVNRSQGVKYLGLLCERLGYKFEVVKI